MGGSTKKSWLPIEANPSVISTYIKSMGGPPDIEFCDVLGFEDWALEMIPSPVLAVLVLFPVNSSIKAKERAERERISSEGQTVSDKLWFTVQTIGNACGTIGLLHAIANIEGLSGCEPGGVCDTLFQKTRTLSAVERAMVIEADDSTERYHEIAQMMGQSAVPSEDEKIFLHFVTLLPKEGSLYEMDGRKPFPINHGSCSSETFLKDAVKVFQDKFVSHAPGDLRFSMIAVCKKAV